MGPKLKTTTAVLACLNLVAPYSAFAQAPESQAIQDAVEACREPNSDACLEATERALQSRGEGAAAAGDAAETPSDEGAVATPEAADDADATAEAPAETPAPDAAEVPAETVAPEAAEVPAETAAPEAAEAPVEPAAPEAAEAPAETAAPEAAEAPAEPAAPEAAGNGAMQATEAEPAAPEQSEESEEGMATTPETGEAAAATEPAADAGAAESAIQVPEGTDAAPPEAMTEDTDAAPADEPSAGTATGAGTEASPDAAEMPDADTAAAPSPEAPTAEGDAAETDDATLDDAMQDAMDEGGETEQADTAPAAPDTAPETGSEAPAMDEADASPSDEAGTADQATSGTAAATAAAADAEPADVVTEMITEDDARSSSEDFATAIDRTADGDAQAQAEESGDDDDGMSALEKALLLGAGALAVGTLIRGNREVVASSDDRVVVSDSNGDYQLIKDDNTLLARPGTEVQTQTYDDGSTRTIVNREDGSQIVTIRDASLRVLRRERITPDGQRILLIDDTQDAAPVDMASLRPAASQASVTGTSDEAALRQALATQGGFDRAYSLAQVRDIAEVRSQVPAIDLDNITFASGSAAISPEQAEALTALGRVIRESIADDPGEIFLVEGHTDAVGDAALNLALSDRRAESVALALSEYFDVPPENLVVQGYGERFLKVQTEADERANRRATVRRITPLLQVAAAQ